MRGKGWERAYAVPPTPGTFKNHSGYGIYVYAWSGKSISPTLVWEYHVLPWTPKPCQEAFYLLKAAFRRTRPERSPTAKVG